MPYIDRYVPRFKPTPSDYRCLRLSGGGASKMEYSSNFCRKKVVIRMKKTVALFVAVIMIAGAGFVLADSVDADTSTTYGSFDIYINYGTGWSAAHSAQGYDAAIALKNYTDSNNIALVIDSSTFTESYGYKNINVDYGTVSAIGSSVSNDVSKWNVIYYPATGSAWTVGPNDALGLYKPFADYNETYRTANIALYYGTADGAASAVSSLPVTDLNSVVPLTTIQNNSDFAVSFFIKIMDDNNLLDRLYDRNQIVSVNNLPNVTEDVLVDGMNITGHGSDLYLALKNAIGNNISAVDEVPGHYDGYLSNYSWMNSMFGLGTVLLDDKGDEDWSNDIYSWWTQYTEFTDDDNADNDVKSDFVLGYYSPLSGAPNTLTSYSLIYSEGTA